MRTSEEIVKIIKKEVDTKDMSISELARRVGMSKSGISLIFNGKRQFPVNRAKDFADVLNISPEYVLGFDLRGNKVDDPKYVPEPIETKKDPIINEMIGVAKELKVEYQKDGLDYLKKLHIKQQKEEKQSLEKRKEEILKKVDQFDIDKLERIAKMLDDED